MIGCLFSGYGGLSMAVGDVLSMDTAWHAEVEPAACRVLAHHWPDVPNLGDVSAVDWTQAPEVDVITAGFPCQDLSYAGKGAGIREGTRSGLWSAVVAAVRGLGPRLVVLENVAAIVARRPGLDVVLADLAALGYDATWTCLRAADVGAPHGRDRWFCVAFPAGDAPLRGRHEGAAARGGEGRPVAAGGSGRFAAHPHGTRPQGGGGPVHPGPHDGHAGRGDRVPVALLPTPRSAADRTSRRQLIRDGHWSAPGLGQAVELMQGVLPREYESWDEVQGASRLLPTPRSTDGPKDGPGQGNGRGVADSLPAIGALLPTPTSVQGRNATSGRQPDAEFNSGTTLNDVAYASRWGDYADAIARWEPIIGRPAPEPTEPGKNGKPRLSPRFVEWMMGLPEGHVCDTPDVSRTQALKMLGNGVVPQQASEALRRLLSVAEEVAA